MLAHWVILLSVFFVTLTAFHLLELVFPIHRTYRPGWSRKDYWTDVISAIVNGPVLSGLTKVAVVGLVLMLPRAHHLLTPWPWWLQFAVFFLFNDFARYWLHRWYHESSFLWRFHRVHHTIVEMDAMSVFRFHVLEGIIKNGVIFAPFQMLGLDPLVIVVYSSLDIAKGFWHHANVRTYIGPLNYLLNSAELHWWHHSVEARGQRSNYGSVLSIWDWLFGTAYWPRGSWPERIGVEGMDEFPKTYLGQMTSALYDDEEIIARCGGAEATAAREAPPDAAGAAEPATP